MICRRCQKAMRKGEKENICYRTGETVSITKESCRLCSGSITEGKHEIVEWKRSHNGRMTSQQAKEFIKIRFGEARSKRQRVSVSEDIAQRFYNSIPEKERRTRIDHAILVELKNNNTGQNYKNYLWHNRPKGCPISISEDVAQKFFSSVPRKDRRNRIDHALEIEMKDVV